MIPIINRNKWEENTCRCQFTWIPSNYKSSYTYTDFSWEHRFCYNLQIICIENSQKKLIWLFYVCLNGKNFLNFWKNFENVLCFGRKFLKLPFLSISETHTIQDDLKSFSTALILFIELKNQWCSVSARLVPAVERKLHLINLNIKIFENEKQNQLIIHFYCFLSIEIIFLTKMLYKKRYGNRINWIFK